MQSHLICPLSQIICSKKLHLMVDFDELNHHIFVRNELISLIICTRDIQVNSSAMDDVNCVEGSSSGCAT